MAGPASPAIRVLAFAGAKDVVGASMVELDATTCGAGSSGAAGACTAGQVMDAMCRRFPELVPHRPIIRLAVNGCYVDEQAPVMPGDEVALIPPVAGG